MGLFLRGRCPIPLEPSLKRAFVFIDGQNLFHAAKEAFGYLFPNYDAAALAQYVCAQKGWNLAQTHFYTGIPDAADNAFWNHFWSAKLAAMGRQGVQVFSRPLRYRNQTRSRKAFVRFHQARERGFLHEEARCFGQCVFQTMPGPN